MRRLLTLTLASTAIVAMACGKDKPRTSASMADDLKRDLQLASQTANIQISPDEVAPQAKQELAVRPKKAPTGPRVIRSKQPTVKASATPVEAAEVTENVPQVQVMASAPAPSESPTPDAPPMARPSPVPAQTYPSTGSIPGNGGGSATGTGIGGIIGVILGGGMMGDDDHCDPRRAPRGGRSIPGDIYGRPRGGIGGVFNPRGGGFPIVIGRPR
ncbi:MAG TPA: hypothetical protein VL383_10325 [Gemmatimonadaceae bacterium]|nr:hypothetical protein [Gemmatimonadaceae bacterium]